MDSLNLVHGILETAYSGMENVIEEPSSIRSLVVLASDMPIPKTMYAPAPLLRTGQISRYGKEPALVVHIARISLLCQQAAIAKK